MKQKLLRLTRLRALVLTAVMCVLGAGQAWAQNLTFDFEDDSAHRTSGSNSYTTTNNYSENGVNMALTYADAVTTGSPLTGTANALGRIAKNTTNSPTIVLGPIDNSGYTIKGLQYNIKGYTAMKLAIATSTNNTSWSNLDSGITLPTAKTEKKLENLDITDETVYIKFTVSVSSSTGSNRDFQLDDIVIIRENSGSSSDPSISADNVNLAYDATSGSIAYTLANEVTGGVVSASVPSSSWITLGNGTSSPISFTCEANSSAVARTETVTLTYTYNTNEKVTKDVTVTQTANPNVVDNISDITAAGTYAVQGTIVAKSQRGFIVGDGTGYVYYYNTGYDQSAYNIGDKVKLSGSVVVYGGVYEFNNATTVSAATTSNYVAEDPTVLSGSDMDSRVASTTPAQLSSYVQYQGTLSVDGTHYNITSIDGAQTAIGSISYPISTDFSSLNGKTVKVTGYYVGISTSKYYNTMIGSIEEVAAPVPTEPSIDLGETSIHAYATGTDGVINVSYNNITDVVAEVQFFEADGTTSATYDWVTATINSNNNVEYGINPNTGDARTAYFKVYALDDDANDVYSELITVTQDAYVAPVADYATLPFAFNSGKADIDKTDGLTQDGLGSDYNASNAPTTQLKFDGSGDYIVLKINERPGKLTFDIKGNSFSGGTFKVQTSEDGNTYTDLKTYTELGDTQSEEFTNLGENVRYIKWIYTEKVSGNVGLGNISLAAYSTTPIINANNINIASDVTSGEIAYTIDNPVTGTALTASTNDTWLTLGAVGTTVPFTCSANDAGTERSATITLTYGNVTKDVTVTQAGNPNAVMTIAEARAQGTGDVVTKGVVTSCSGTTAYIQDATAAICVYGKALTVGDEVKVEGTLSTYKGLLEITSPTTTVLSSSNTITPEVMTIVQVNASTNQGWLVKIEDATVTGIDGQNTTIEQNGSSIVVRGISSSVTIAVNDIITLTGNIGCFEVAQIANPRDVSVQAPPAVPTIMLEGATNNTIEYKAAYESYPWGASYAYTVENYSGNSAVQFTYCDASGNPVTDTPSWFNAQISDTHLMFYCRAENTSSEARYGYVKMFIEDAGTKYYSDLITVKQKGNVVDYATLPFDWDDTTTPTGITNSGVGTYTSSPYLKFDGSGDYIVLKINERPGTLTFDIKGNTFSGGTFKVQTSEDGITYTDLETYTDLSTTLNEEFTNLGENVRYIKWIYTEKASGNVALGNIALAAYVAPQTYTLSWTADQHVSDIFIFDSEDQNTQLTSGDEVLSGHTIIVSVDFESDYELDELSINNGAVTATWNDTEACYSFTMPAEATTISVTSKAKPVEGNWVKTDLADLTADDVFVIVSTKGSDSYAMSNDNGTSAPTAVAVTVVGNSLSGDIANNLMWTVSGNATDGYSFYPNGDTENWLYCNNSNNGVRVGTNEAKVFSLENGYLKHNGTSRYVGVYNSSDWRCYTSNTGTSNIAGQTFAFYKFDADYTRTATVGKYGTICLPRNGQVVGAELYSIAGKSEDSNSDITSISLAEVTGNLEAGKPYIFKATTSKILVAYTSNDVAASADSDNGLVGSFSRQLLDNASGNLYVIKNNQVCKVGTGVYVGENKAYIDASQIVNSGTNGVKIFAEGVIDAIDGINGEIRSGVIYNIAGQRLQRPVRGINIINGKKVLVK